MGAAASAGILMQSPIAVQCDESTIELWWQAPQRVPQGLPLQYCLQVCHIRMLPPMPRATGAPPTQRRVFVQVQSGPDAHDLYTGPSTKFVVGVGSAGGANAPLKPGRPYRFRVKVRAGRASLVSCCTCTECVGGGRTGQCQLIDSAPTGHPRGTRNRMVGLRTSLHRRCRERRQHLWERLRRHFNFNFNFICCPHNNGIFATAAAAAAAAAAADAGRRW